MVNVMNMRCVEIGQALCPRIRASVSLRRLALISATSFALAGCGSIQVPLGDVFGSSDEGMQTASISAPTELSEPLETAPVPEPVTLPDTLTAVSPIAPAEDRREANAVADDILASFPERTRDQVSLTQADLDAMGRALTYVLSTQDEPGTFAWAHEATGRSGVMTPFRRLSSSDQGACRVISVEITDGGKNTILLADACRQGTNWVFITPRPGDVL